VDEELSLGDFVLSGGELPALALMDALIGNCRRVERCRFGGGRFLRQRFARLPALHPARSLQGMVVPEF